MDSTTIDIQLIKLYLRKLELLKASLLEKLSKGNVPNCLEQNLREVVEDFESLLKK